MATQMEQESIRGSRQQITIQKRGRLIFVLHRASPSSPPCYARVENGVKIFGEPVMGLHEFGVVDLVTSLNFTLDHLPDYIFHRIRAVEKHPDDKIVLYE